MAKVTRLHPTTRATWERDSRGVRAGSRTRQRDTPVALSAWDKAKAGGWYGEICCWSFDCSKGSRALFEPLNFARI